MSRTLAIDLFHRGFGWAVLEGSERLVEAGLAHVKKPTEERLLERVGRVLDRFEPDMFVLDDPDPAYRQEKTRRRIQAIGAYVVAEDVHVMAVTREQVAREFAATGTKKHEIAVAVARQFPDLAHRLPPERKPWKPEDERQNIFDAVALALAALRKVEWRK